ncbi:hypothetical protein [Saccharomonospora iraqiensis]|uniref:hypothetical protein n=1 Tax=Saccharomonospora iraqiensis TaxID=52698 RepID=UPI00040B3DDD|nr:hypothetical protein [Saccharomonospora iraqiensis]
MLSNLLDENHARVPLRFRVPDEFWEIALDEPPEERARRTFDGFRGKLGLTERQAFHLAFSQEHMVVRLRDQGAVYVGQCVARSEIDPAVLTSAQYTILVKKADLDAEDPLDAVAGGLRKSGEPREVLFTEFPAGKALVVGEELAVTSPFGPLGEPRPTSQRVRQAQVVLPFPDRRRLAIIGVSSENLADWPSYVEILDGIARSVSFTDPPTRSIAGVLG